MKEDEMEARRRDLDAEHFGLLDEGQPTLTAHIDYVRSMEAEFSATERRLIRHHVLGGPVKHN